MEYTFRVCAENMAGIGMFGKSSDAVICRDSIDPPGRPETVDAGRNTVSLQWKKPAYDGGSRITGKEAKL